MRIKQLRLKNFRGIKNLELNFDITQSVAVLVGINGVGKSSILDCISTLISSFYSTDIRYAFYNRDIHTGQNSTSNRLLGIIDGKEIQLEIEKNRQEVWSGVLDDGNNYQYAKYPCMSIHYLANRKSISIQDFILIHRMDDPETKSMFQPEALNTKNFPCAMDIINFDEFTNWFNKLEDLENETRLSIDNHHRDIKLEATRKAIYSMLGEGYSNLRMKRAIDKLTIYKADQEIELDWLSDGEKGLLALAGDLARRLAVTYPNSADPLKEAGLVLIDEIELHLHPAWQRIIIQRLTQTFPGCQFIVTTHSPQVLSNVQPECIHVLALEDDNVVVKRPERSYGRDSNRILEDIMGVTKRPPEIEARILELFRVIHDGELAQAKGIIQDLASEIGIDEPELIRAASTIHRREVIGR
jgi:predicted ATP-binding protein involved in virulence